MTGDRELLESWWRQFVATGRVSPALEHVQSRLIRSVHRGQLPGGPVYVKTMTFPRGKDRLRYLLRELPAEHEAAALRQARAAGLACPEVLDVRVARCWGLPSRSWLVLRSLATATEDRPSGARLRDEAALALRLLTAGIVHRDLHSENFVRLADGELAVLDMQSTTLRSRDVADPERRVAAAARLVRDRHELCDPGRLLLESGLLRDAGEVDRALLAAERQRLAYLRRRVLRCLTESTEFERIVHWSGVEHRRRGPLPPGCWFWGGERLRRAWIGQRALQVFSARPLAFAGFWRKWWWPSCDAGLYVPDECCDRFSEELARAEAGHELFLQRTTISEVKRDGEGNASQRGPLGQR